MLVQGALEVFAIDIRNSYIKVNWDTVKQTINVPLWGKVGDTARGIELTILQNGARVIPNLEKIKLYWQKPDGTKGFVAASKIGDFFYLENLSQMFTVEGTVNAEFELEANGQFLKSPTFYPIVETSLANGVESSDQFTALQQALIDISTCQQQLAEKVDKVAGKGLSTNDYTATEKNKLAGIEVGATADQVALDVPITDVGGHYTSTNVEGALQEVGAALTDHTENLELLNDLKADITYVDTRIDDVDSKIIVGTDEIPSSPLLRVADRLGSLSETDISTQLAEIENDVADKAQKLKATNLVVNGDFSQGLTGWTLRSNPTYIETVENGRYKATIAAAITTTDFYLRPAVNTVSGNKYYLACVIIPAKSAGVNSFQLGASVVSLTLTPLIENRPSAVLTATNTSSPVLNHRTTNYATGDSLYIDNFIVIDLTAIFGAGNEPTKEQMDRLLAEFPNSWFDGTQEILPLKAVPQLLEEKANKAQEAWITPTLVNGATGTIRYRKNQFGKLEFTGNLTTISGASAFNMHLAYRPLQEIRFPVTATDGTLGVIIIVTGGSLYASPSNKSLVVANTSISLEV